MILVPSQQPQTLPWNFNERTILARQESREEIWVLARKVGETMLGKESGVTVSITSQRYITSPVCLHKGCLYFQITQWISFSEAVMQLLSIVLRVPSRFRKKFLPQKTWMRAGAMVQQLRVLGTLPEDSYWISSTHSSSQPYVMPGIVDPTPSGLCRHCTQYVVYGHTYRQKVIYG